MLGKGRDKEKSEKPQKGILNGFQHLHTIAQADDKGGLHSHPKSNVHQRKCFVQIRHLNGKTET